MSRIAVIDFETTGMSPDEGSRATEVGIVMIEGGRVVDRFQSLMNAGAYVSPFITQLTGITNEMVEAAPPADRVMREAARFVGDAPMVAHNAAFDRKFWVDELARVDEDASQPFACTVLLARRLYPQAPNHRLGTLRQWLGITPTGRAHRALADAETAAAVLLHMLDHLRTQHGVPEPDHALLVALQSQPRAKLGAFLQDYEQKERLAGVNTA